MSDTCIDSNDDIWNIQKKEFETDTQFEFRKNIYDNVYNDTHNKQK